MKRIGLIFILAELLLVAGSCGGNKKPENYRPQTLVQAKTVTQQSKPIAQEVSPGEAAFRKNCLTCHQADGSGVPDMYPSLNKAELIMGPPEGVVKAILFGLKGPKVINGHTYTLPMPPLSQLSDSTIAGLVNYVKKRWGDAESSVTAEDVKKIRAAGKN